MKKVKVGDLVKWMHPDAIDYGLVLEMLNKDRWGRDKVYIQWYVNPYRSGPYSINNGLLAVISKSR